MRTQTGAPLWAVGSLALALQAGACRTVPRSPSPARADSLAADSISRFVDVQVENHNWADVVVYVVHGGTRTRLGTASTARSTELRFPASYAFADRVSLLATPIGSRSRVESERFKVSGGQTVVWTIETSLSRSSLMVR